MVGDGDERALPVAGVDAAGGVGDDEGFAADEAEDAGGEGDLGEGVALVGVDAALHDGDRDSGDGAENEVAGVAFYGRAGEVGDLGVGDARGASDVVGEVAEAGAEDDADVGFQVRRGADVVSGGLGVAEEVDHPGSCGRFPWGTPHCPGLN